MGDGEGIGYGRSDYVTSSNKLILNIKEKNKRGVEFYLNFN